MIKRFDDSIDQYYDAIVIGSGMGGLGTAGILAKHGKKVLVLEKHYMAGGLTHSFKRKRFEWDVGLHYMGNVHDKGHILRQTYDYITDSKLQWHHIEDPYDRIHLIDNDNIKTKVELNEGLEGFVNSLLAAFPNEKNAIEKYVTLITDVSEAINNYMAERLLPEWLGKILYPVLSNKFRRYSDLTTGEVLDQITNNKELINTLTARYGNYGLPPSKSSFAAHAVVVQSYLQGANYPVGGTSKISEYIGEVIAQQGGCICIDTGVKNIILNNKRAEGVYLENGRSIYAKHIISNVGYKNTIEQLLPSGLVYSDLSKINSADQLNAASGHINLFVGLDGKAEEFGITQSNYWYVNGIDQDESYQAFMEDWTEEFPFVFIASPSEKDPSRTTKDLPLTSISMIAPASTKWFERWKNKPWGNRGKDYEDFKEYFSQNLLAHLYKYFPKTKGKVKLYELSTPLSTAHFCQRPDGATYGFAHSPERFSQHWLRPSIPVKGLYLVGQDMVTVGVSAALISSLLATSLILRKNMMSYIPKAIKKEEVAL